MALCRTPTFSCFRGRLAKIQQDRVRIHEELTQTDEQLALGADLLQAALVLVDDPQQLYRQSSDALRRQLNLTFYERLYVEDESISDRELNWPFTELFEASGRYQRLRPQDLINVDTNMRPRRAGAHAETNADLLATDSSAGGSSKTALVGVAGFELLQGPFAAIRRCAQLSAFAQVRGHIASVGVHRLPRLSAGSCDHSCDHFRDQPKDRPVARCT